MKKFTQSVVYLLSLTMAIVLMSGAEGIALTLDDKGDYQLGGYLQNRTGIRLQDSKFRSSNGEQRQHESGDFSMFRNELFLDFSARISDEFQFKMIGRGHHEGVWGIDSDVDQNPKNGTTTPGPDELDMESDFDFREYYATYTAGDFVFKIGRQQVAWGEADAMRLADIINPLDLSWRWSFPVWEEIRIPLKMLNAFYTVPANAYELKFEVVYIPTEFTPTKFADTGANWALYSALGYSDVLEDAIFKSMDDGLPDEDMSNPSGGMRIRAQFGSWETYWFGYYGRDQVGVFQFDPAYAAINPTFPMKFHYPNFVTLGGTFNVYWPLVKSVIRGEFAYAIDQPYSRIDAGPYEEKDTISFMLGFDHNAWIRFLNPTKTFYFSGQIFNKFVLDQSDGELRTFLGNDDTKGYQFISSLLVNTEYYEGKIIPELLGVSFVESESGFFDAKITYKPTFSLSFTLGYLNIWGNGNQAGLYFGPIKDNDEAYFKVKLSF